MAYLGVNDYQKAITELQAALEMRKDWPEALDNLGFAYLQLKDYDQGRGRL